MLAAVGTYEFPLFEVSGFQNDLDEGFVLNMETYRIPV